MNAKWLTRRILAVSVAALVACGSAAGSGTTEAVDTAPDTFITANEHYGVQTGSGLTGSVPMDASGTYLVP